MPLSGGVSELAPGCRGESYHYDENNETLLLVLAGTVTVRAPDGEHRLEAGEMVRFPAGPAGARELANPGPEPARVLTVSTAHQPALRCFPESGTVRITPPGALYRPVHGNPG